MKVTKSIRQAIIAGVLKTPVQRGFLLTRWQAALDQLSPPSPEDQRLYECGIFFASQLSSLRALLQERPPPSGNSQNLLRRAVGAVNFQAEVARNQEPADELGPAAFASELAHRQVSLAGSVNSVSAPELIESIVDGLRFEIATLLRERSLAESDTDRGPRDISAVQRILTRLNLSVFYHVLEEQWLDCLHHGYAVQHFDSKLVIGPFAEPLRAEDHAVGSYREHSLDVEVINGAKAELEENFEGHLGLVRNASRKKRLAVKVIPSDVTRSIILNEITAADPDIAPFLDCVVDGQSGLCVSQMIAIWEALVPLCHRITSPMPSDDTIVNVRQLEAFAPIYKINELRTALQTCTGISSPCCAAAIEVFTWRGIHDSLWLRPLVPLSQGHVILVNPGVVAPNLRRSIEYWLQCGENNLSRRGIEFENHIRRELVSWVSENPTLQKTWVSSRSVKPTEATVGDIDVLAVIGETVFVGECKCFVRPATSHEWFQAEDGIQAAVRQVEGKAKWVRENPQWVASISWRNITPKFTVVPCVILNTPLMALRTVDEVPIVDQRILYRFFGTSSVSQFKRLDTGKMSTPITIYSSDEEAGNALRNYLRDPPHLSQYRSSIEFDAIRQPDFANGQEWITNIFPRVKLRVSEELQTELSDDI